MNGAEMVNLYDRPNSTNREMRNRFLAWHAGVDLSERILRKSQKGAFFASAGDVRVVRCCCSVAYNAALVRSGTTHPRHPDRGAGEKDYELAVSLD